MPKKFEWTSAKWKSILLLILILQMTTAVYFCYQKAGFHYDEYYSYYSSNVTYGLVPTDREWKNTDEIKSEFSVAPGERFQYAMVVLMQTYDVHPPVYYLILHTVCSFFPNVFSKWLGLSINLLGFLICFFLLAKITDYVSRGNWKIILSVCLLYGFNPGIISGITFIRMYILLCVWVLLLTLLHIRTMDSGQRTIRGFYLPMMITIYLGFLTHYYFIVFLFFMAGGMTIYLFWKNRNIRECIFYAGSVVLSLMLAVLSYRACLGHIFRGYRGTEATESFFDLGNTWNRICFFYGLLNHYVFGGLLGEILILLLLQSVFAIVLWKKQLDRKKQMQTILDRRAGLLLIGFTAICYFAVVTKTALLNAEEANRYQLPVYAFMILLVIMSLYLVGKYVLSVSGTYQNKRNRIAIKAACFLGITALLVSELVGLYSGKVLFLYKEDAKNVAFADAHCEDAIVYLYNPTNQWMIWDDSMELMQYEKIYFVNMNDTNPITDEIVNQAKHLYIYSSRGENSKVLLDSLLKTNTNLSSYKKVRSLLYCDLFYAE